MTEPLVLRSVPVKPSNATWLSQARFTAAEMAKERFVAAEDLRGVIPDPVEPNWWGFVFAGPWFKQVGERASRHPSAHGRKVKTYMLTPKGRELVGE